MKKPRMTIDQVSRHLIQLSNQEGTILIHRDKLMEKLDRKLSGQHLQSWKNYGLVKDFDYTPRAHNSLIYLELDMDKCCRAAGISNPHKTKIQKKQRSLKKPAEMSFFQKIKTVVNLMNTLFFKKQSA